MKSRILLLLFCLPFFLHGQIVNTEKVRSKKEQKGFSGSISGNFSIIRNTRQIIQVDAKLRIDYATGRHRWMSINNGMLSKADEADLVNAGFTHLRYNYQVSPLVTWEAFTQFQYNQIQKIKVRGLWGTGPRFRLVENDSARFFIGVLYMYEYAELTAPKEFRRDHRMSSYVSAGYAFTAHFSIDHISYYQPNLQAWGDFRLSSETLLTFKVRDNLAFKASFQMLHDQRPAEGVPNLNYRWKNGLSYTF